MKNEHVPIVVIFGENEKIGQGKGFLETQPDQMSPVSRISSVAAGVVGKHEEPDSELWYVGCDPFRTGNEEAKQMRDRTVSLYPDLAERTKIFTGLVDTSLQVEALSRELRLLGRRNREVSVVLPIEHFRRAIGQLKANDIGIRNGYLAHEKYILDPDIKREVRKERIREVRSIYFTWQMYFDIMREFGLNVIGNVDNKGLLIRKASEHFRKDNNLNYSTIS